MNKSSIKKILLKATGGSPFINQNQLKNVMKWGNDRTRTCLKELDFIRNKRTKQYDIDEVATAIMEEVEVAG